MSSTHKLRKNLCQGIQKINITRFKYESTGNPNLTKKGFVDNSLGKSARIMHKKMQSKSGRRDEQYYTHTRPSESFQVVSGGTCCEFKTT